MRTALQALLADRPRLVVVGVALRWLVWLAIGHPAMVLVAAFALARGFGLLASFAIATLAEFGFSAWGMSQLTRGAKAMCLWQQIARFRRRFPAAFAKAHRDPRLLALAVGNIYSAPGGLRPVLSAPGLGVMPRAFGYETVGWTLLPRPQHRTAELELAMAGIADADRGLVSLRVHRKRDGSLALIARFAQPTRRWTGVLTAHIDDLDGGPGGRPPSTPTAERADSPTPDRVGLGPPVRAEEPDDPFNIFLNLAEPEPATPQSPNEEENAMIIETPDQYDAQDIYDVYNFGDTTVPQTSFSPSLIQGPAVEAPSFIDRTSSLPKTKVPLGWSLFVIAPANVIAGLAVITADAGRVGTVALFAMAAVSLLLVSAEAMNTQ